VSRFTLTAILALQEGWDAVGINGSLAQCMQKAFNRSEVEKTNCRCNVAFLRLRSGIQLP
jgi:hypothetical protein